MAAVTKFCRTQQLLMAADTKFCCPQPLVMAGDTKLGRPQPLVMAANTKVCRPQPLLMAADRKFCSPQPLLMAVDKKMLIKILYVNFPEKMGNRRKRLQWKSFQSLQEFRTIYHLLIQQKTWIILHSQQDSSQSFYLR